MRLIILLLVSFGALAAEEPEAVYGKFHRAIAAANLEEAMRYAPLARRAELAGMSQAQKEAQIKMLSLLMPRAFTLLNKSVAPGGKSARLVVTGPGQPIVPGARPQPMYGEVKMVNENGEWKVDETSWSDQKPAAAAMPAKPAAPAPAPQRTAAQKAGPTQYVPSEPPARRLGAARQECVYKPVMTNEDLERCR